MSQYHFRKINKEKVETNYALGGEYSIISKRKNRKHFDQIVKSNFDNEIHSNVYGFIKSCNGKIFCLEKDSESYIMTESGATFSNLTKR